MRDVLQEQTSRSGQEVFLAGRDAVLCGDPKQANPIGDEPMYREGDYVGKGVNKPRGSQETPGNAWTTKKLVRMGMGVRNSFQDTAFLRQVHRFEDANDGVPERLREAYREDAFGGGCEEPV